MTHDPFPPGSDQSALWQMLIFRDVNAFAACDWDAHAADFLPADRSTGGFIGISGNQSDRPEDWLPAFPTLADYRENWLGAAKGAAARADRETLAQAHFAASRLVRITINGTLALCVKRFDGTVTYRDGQTERLAWQTAYICRKADARWWIAGFVGFLPPSGYTGPG